MLLESTVNEFYIREAYGNDRNNKENNKRMVNNANTDLYISFDNRKVGEIMAQAPWYR